MGYASSIWLMRAMGYLATFTADSDAGAGMPWGGCDQAVAPAGAAAVG